MARFIGFIVFSIICLGAFIYHKFATLYTGRSVEVMTTTPQYRVIIPTLSLPGEVKFEETRILYAKASGWLSLFVKPGEEIKKGTLLGRIKLDEQLRAEYERQSIEYSQKISELEAKAKSCLEKLKDTEKFYELGVISKCELETSKEEVARITAELRNTKVAYDFLKLQYHPERFQIKAPINCRVIELLVEDGAPVSEKMPILKIGAVDKIKIEAKVSSYDLIAIKKAKRIIVKPEFMPTTAVEGELVYLSPFADTKGNFALEVKLKGDFPVAQLTPGIAVFIEFQQQKSQKILTIPIEAIHKEADKDMVYIVKGDRAYAREVKCGISDEEFVEIKSGVSPDDEVVTTYYGELLDKVKIIKLK
jgi:RND family efflux transporter MFP subunit